jgi:hypothetical protein
MVDVVVVVSRDDGTFKAQSSRAIAALARI